jgi:outer membrane protein assembly factor BamE (lipoprotein component of BamABCDE complex)
MKTKTLTLIALALPIGCAEPPPPSEGPPPSIQKATAATVDDSETPPFVGMTKAQVFARYGEPGKNTITDEGEQWVYLLNHDEVMAKALIPFNFNVILFRNGVLTFGPDGKVKKFTWDAPIEGS